MDKYLQNIIAIFFIVILALFLFAYWLDLSFGYGQIFLLVAGGYGIYLNFKDMKKVKNKRKQTSQIGRNCRISVFH